MPKWKQSLYRIIFESDTPAGKLFDVVLLAAIIISVTAVCLDSVASIRQVYGPLFRVAEWCFTILFTVEYICRIICTERKLKYIFSFYGVIDLVSFLPTYLGVLLPGAHSLLVVRIFRLMRVFRILKLGHYVAEARLLSLALYSSRQKIAVFLLTVSTVTLIAATLMYLIEGGESGFHSIPRSLYWAVVTVTTVGYGDISPQTTIGQMLASFLMILGYGVIAVPTGIVSAEISKQGKKKVTGKRCQECGEEDHAWDALFCKHCGKEVPKPG
ncbi:MAG: ion transporter [Deltaproteobacteria bacterium]|nr:ion transporter [Deltaproteobacteria bacterium]